jgi:calreticulin
LILLAGFVLYASATVYFTEEFNDGWEKRWVESFPKKDEGTQGKWVVSAGKYYGDAA